MGEPSPTRAVVAEAPDALTASIWVDALQDAGIDATSFVRGNGAALGGAEAFATYPVLVDGSQLGAARSVIADLDGGASLAPVPDRESEIRRQVSALAAVGGIVAAIVIAAAAVKLFA